MPEAMSLRNDAVELSRVLNQIVESAKDSRSEYVAGLVKRIAPAVARYDAAVFELHSRDVASSALAEVADDLDALSAAATKGELHTFKGNALDLYWRLRTIYRESKYRDEAL